MKTTAKMVVVWGNENILSTSIQYLLANRAEWKVVMRFELRGFGNHTFSCEKINFLISSSFTRGILMNHAICHCNFYRTIQISG